MPTYEYECTKCGARVDIFQSMSEPARKKLKKDDPKPCNCNGTVRRLIGTGAGVIFKGSGFYETDYRSESYKKAAKDESEKAKAKSDKPAKGDKSSGTSDNSGDKKPKSDANPSRTKKSDTTA